MMGFAEEWLTDPKYGSWRHVFGCGFCLSDRARDARVECSQNVISTLLDSLYNELTVFRTLSVLRSIHHTILLLLFSLEISDNIFHLKAAFRYRRGCSDPRACGWISSGPQRMARALNQELGCRRYHYPPLSESLISHHNHNHPIDLLVPSSLPPSLVPSPSFPEIFVTMDILKLPR